MGVGKASIPVIIGLLLISSVVFADDFDFQASVDPTTITIENCQSLPTLAVTVKNPFFISGMDIYADGQNICRLGNNELRTCYYASSGILPPGTSSGQRTDTLTVQGVGVSGTFDSGKTKTRTFNIIVYHSPSSAENSASSAMLSAQNRINAAQVKLNDYSSRGYDMSTAQSHLSTAYSSVSQAQSNFNSCSFGNTQSLAVQAQSSADQAISQAENTFQAQKSPLTGEILGSKSESEMALIGIVLIAVIVTIILIRRRSKKPK